MLSRAFKGVASPYSKVSGFTGWEISGLQGPQGVEGQRAPWVTADPKVSRLQEPKGSVPQVNGQGLGLPIINGPQGMKVFLEAPRSRD